MAAPSLPHDIDEGLQRDKLWRAFVQHPGAPGQNGGSLFQCLLDRAFDRRRTLVYRPVLVLFGKWSSQRPFPIPSSRSLVVSNRAAVYQLNRPAGGYPETSSASFLT